MKIVEGPLFEHDCEACLYLFSLEANGKKVDFYKCTKCMSEMVGRFSGEPSDYTTIPEQAAHILGVSMSEIRQAAQEKLGKALPHN